MSQSLSEPQVKALFAKFEELEIEVDTHLHDPLFTVEDSQKLRGEISGGHTKNLFLKDKKDNFFLLTLGESATIDLKTVHQKIGASSRVSFGKPDKLFELLGVKPGAVTALGVVNDKAGRVKIFLDSKLMEHEVINCHPLLNDATVSIKRADLIKFIEASGHQAHIMALSE